MKLPALLFLLCMTVIITVGLVGLMYYLQGSAPLPKGTRTLAYMFTVNDTVGVDVGTDMLRLGAVKPGDSSWRTVTISDAISQAVVSNQTVKAVRVTSRGQGSEWLSIQPSVVELPGNVLVNLTVPTNAKYGTYRGELVVIPVSTS